MADLPPPTPPPDRDGPTAEQAARLERLTRRAQAADATAATRSSQPRRKHPTKGARAAALGMSLATTAGLAGVFATISRPAVAETSAAIVSGGSDRTPLGADAPTPAPTVVDIPVPTPTGASPATTETPVARDQRAVGPTVVDGAVFRNKWGPVQVEATFGPDGTLTDVATLQTPAGRRQSVSINDFAVPRLTSEALTAQSAEVDTVSGATYTSDGYRRSLQSAIDLARDAGVTTIA